MSVLTKEESLIVLFETCVEYRNTMRTVVDTHAELLNFINKFPHIPVDIRVQVHNETNKFLPLLDKIEGVEAFISNLQAEYLKATKPLKH